MAVQDRRGLYLAPLLLYVLVFALLPLVATWRISTRSVHIGTTNTPYVGLANYRRQLLDERFRSAVGFSTKYTAITVLGSFSIGSLLWMLLVRSRSYSKVLLVLSITPLLLPASVAAQIWRWFFDDIDGAANVALIAAHLRDQPLDWLGQKSIAPLILIAFSIWRRYPVVLLTFWVSYSLLPRLVREAAVLDGSSYQYLAFGFLIRAYRHVFLACLLVILFLAAGDFEGIYPLTLGGPAEATTNHVVLAYEVGIRGSRFSDAICMLILSLPVVAAAAFGLSRCFKVGART